MPLTEREWNQLKTAIECAAAVPTHGMFETSDKKPVFVMPRNNVLILLETFVEDSQPETLTFDFAAAAKKCLLKVLRYIEMEIADDWTLMDGAYGEFIPELRALMKDEENAEVWKAAEKQMAKFKEAVGSPPEKTA